MARTFDGSTQFFIGNTPVTAAPMTMAAWINVADAADECIISITNGTTDANSNRIRLVTGTLQARSQGAGGGGVAGTIGTVSTGTPAHVAGVFASTSSRTAYLNGTAGTPETSTRTPSGIDKIGIGVNASAGTNSERLNGAIWDAAVWDVALTAAEIAALAKGISPRQIRPQSLVWYRPFIRETNDIVGGAALTETGTTTVTAHGRVYA